MDEKKSKLTKPQRALLEELNGGTFLHYMGYMGRFRPNAYWFASGTMNHYKPVTVSKLIEGGYLRRESDGYDKVKAFITDKGKQAVAS